MNIKYILSFASGVGIGIAGSIFYLKQKYKKIADEEINSIKDAYYKKVDELYAQYGEDTHDDISTEEGDVVSTTTEERINKTLMSQYRETVTDYTSMHISRPEPEIVKEAPVVRDVYSIDEELYSESNLNYDKRLLHFYVDDHTIFDPDNVEILTPVDSIGVEGATLVSTEEDVYSHYFRDDRNECDYEIIKVAGAYYE